MPIVKMSSKGQIVIPIEIRKKLGIKPGQSLKGKPSMAQALVKERKQEVEREEEITARFLRRSGVDPR